MNKTHCFREKLPIVCSLSCTYFGQSWVTFEDLQVITERSGVLIYAMWYHYTLFFVITWSSLIMAQERPKHVQDKLQMIGGFTLEQHILLVSLSPIIDGYCLVFLINSVTYLCELWYTAVNQIVPWITTDQCPCPSPKILKIWKCFST
jgi:hypothetical protein